MSSQRQQIVDAVEAKLQLIAPGQQFELPDGPYICRNTIKTVVSWRKTAFSKAEVPAINFHDGDARTTTGPSTKHEHALNFELEIHTAGATSASAVRSIMADVVAAIGSDPRWGGLAYWTTLDGENVSVDQAGEVVSAAQVRFTITYRTPLWRV